MDFEELMKITDKIFAMMREAGLTFGEAQKVLESAIKLLPDQRMGK